MDSILIEAILKDRKIAYAITNRELQVVALGGQAELLFSGQETWLGRSLVDLVPELVGSEAALQAILAGALPRLELAWVNRPAAGGEVIYLTLVELPYHDRAGQITGLIHLVNDVSESGWLKQRLAQQRNELLLLSDALARQNVELEAAISELKQLDELKSRFISVAGHELRTPITSISGYIEVILEEEISPLSPELREYLEIVRGSADRMLQTVNSLLDVNRIEAGRVELVLRPVDLPGLVATTAAEYRPQLKSQRKELALEIAANLPHALCDQGRAMQVVSNLLSNAIKFTPDGGHIRLEVALAEEKGFLQVAVMDNGPGIAPEEHDKVFSRFFRAKSTISSEQRGAGLGLYIARCLVELHGGRIWFKSKLHQGSTFYVTFPIADAPAIPSA